MMIEEAGYRGGLLSGQRCWDDQIISVRAEERKEKGENLEVTQCSVLTEADLSESSALSPLLVPPL